MSFEDASDSDSDTAQQDLECDLKKIHECFSPPFWHNEEQQTQAITYHGRLQYHHGGDA